MRRTEEEVGALSSGEMGVWRALRDGGLSVAEASEMAGGITDGAIGANEAAHEALRGVSVTRPHPNDVERSSSFADPDEEEHFTRPHPSDVERSSSFADPDDPDEDEVFNLTHNYSFEEAESESVSEESSDFADFEERAPPLPPPSTTSEEQDDDLSSEGEDVEDAPPLLEKKHEAKVDDGWAAVIEECTCPISLALMVDPVLCSDGHVYEREAITTWLETRRVSPLTRERLRRREMRGVAALERLGRNAALRSTMVDDETRQDFGERALACALRADDLPGVLEVLRDFQNCRVLDTTGLSAASVVGLRFAQLPTQRRRDVTASIVALQDMFQFSRLEGSPRSGFSLSGRALYDDGRTWPFKRPEEPEEEVTPPCGDAPRADL